MLGLGENWQLEKFGGKFSKTCHLEKFCEKFLAGDRGPRCHPLGGHPPYPPDSSIQLVRLPLIRLRSRHVWKRWPLGVRTSGIRARTEKGARFQAPRALGHFAQGQPTQYSL